MRRAVALALMVAPALMASAAAPLVTGTWMTENGKAVVAVAPCGSGLCGRLVGLSLPRPGGVVRDIWGRSECGETILQMTRRAPDGHWHGIVIDPRDGARYTAELWRTGDVLRLRGYVLVPALGKTEDWPAFSGAIRADCALSARG